MSFLRLRDRPLGDHELRKCLTPKEKLRSKDVSGPLTVALSSERGAQGKGGTVSTTMFLDSKVYFH